MIIGADGWLVENAEGFPPLLRVPSVRSTNLSAGQTQPQPGRGQVNTTSSPSLLLHNLTITGYGELGAYIQGSFNIFGASVQQLLNGVVIETQNANTAVGLGGAKLQGNQVSSQNWYIRCPAGTGVGIYDFIGGLYGSSQFQVGVLSIIGCDTGAGVQFTTGSIFSVYSAGSVYFSNVTTAFNVTKGAVVNFGGTTPGFSGVTTQISMDGVAHPYSDVTGASPQVIFNNYGTRVMQ